MPFGAHETMETHEILMEKINAISHFNLYARQAKNPQLRDMIVRHQQEEIQSYNELVAYTHDSNAFRPIPPNTEIRGVSPQQIEYGLRNPPQIGPEANATFDDREIGIAMLLCHKNGARNCTWASLECADPHLRRMMLNSAATCVNQAYEVFLFMNQQGMYQIPTLPDHTAKTFMHSYQPAGSALENQYSGQAGFAAGGQPRGSAGVYDGNNMNNSGFGNSGYGTGGFATGGMNNSGIGAGAFNTGSNNTGGFASSGMNNAGMNNSGFASSGMNNAGMNNSGFASGGMNNAGISNSAFASGGMNNSGIGAGSLNTGSNNTGANNTGTSNTGTSNTGASNTGANNTGANNTGASNTGDNNTGGMNRGMSSGSENALNAGSRDSVLYGTGGNNLPQQ